MLVVRARSIALDTGRVQADVTERGPLPELFAIFERVARRIAPSSTQRGGDRPAASAGRGVRELHQGAARRDAGDGDQLPERGPEAAADVRSRAPRAVGRLRRAGRSRARARGGRHPCAAISPWARRARFLAGAVAAAAEEVRRCVRHVQGAGRGAADADGPEQPRRRPAAARRDAADRRADLLLQQGGRGRSGRPGLRLQPRLRLLAEPRRPGGHLLAARGRAPQSGRRRCALRARRGAGRAGQTTAEADAREGAGAAAVVDLRRDGQAAGRRGRAEGARAGQERRRAAARAPDRDERSRRASSAIRRSSRSSISIAAGGSTSRRTIARPSSS